MVRLSEYAYHWIIVLVKHSGVSIDWLVGWQLVKKCLEGLELLND